MNPSLDRRRDYARFPGWTQPFWTWFTGKALPGQSPLFRHAWWSYLIMTQLAFFGGLALSSVAIATLHAGWPLALVAGWALTLWAARAMILVIAHQCIHRGFTGDAQLDDAISEGVTLITVFQDGEAFKQEHCRNHHNQRVFATAQDPPVQVLEGLGFRPGMTKQALWRRAWLVFVSPRFYLAGAWSRLRCNLVSGRWRRAGFFLWAAFWLSVPAWAPNGWAILTFAFILPVIVWAQLSALLDKLGEHAWLTPADPAHGARWHHVSASWARFCASALPDPDLGPMKAIGPWAWWFVKMAFYHLPSRVFVLVGDLPNHDFHHRYPRSPDWMIAPYARQRDIDAGRDGGPPYREIWGMGAAIDAVFESISAAEPQPGRAPAAAAAPAE